MRHVVLLGLLLYAIHAAYAVTHSLQYVYTGTTGINNFPKFVAVGMVDGMQIDYYDSFTEKNQLKQAWMEGARDENSITTIRKGYQQSFAANVKIAMERFNQTQGVHTYQQMYGCEWDDETHTTNRFRQFGFDGEDFIALDFKTMTYTAPVQEAVITKRKWESDKAQLDYLKSYYNQICIDWLKKYVGYGRSTLERKVPPEVSLLQKDPSSPVTCRATGFFPSGIVVSWKKNGEDLQTDVEQGETLPNDDGTFQIMSHLRVKPEDWKKDTYTCTVQHKGLKEDIVKRVYEKEIRTNHENSPPVAIIIGVVAVLLVAVIAIAAFMVWRKRGKPGFVPANTSDDGSNSSSNTAPKA